MRKVLLLTAVLGLSLFWACHLAPEDNQDHFNLAGDSSWADCDTVLVVLLDKRGDTLDTLFNGVLASLSQLENLSAAKYDGGQASLLIRGKKDGGLCFEEKRSFDGAGKNIVVDTLNNPKAEPTGVRVDPESLSIPLGGNAVAVKGMVKPDYADQAVIWSLSGDGVVSLGLPVGGEGNQVQVIPEKIGSTRILVRSRKDSSKSAEIHVTVTASSGIAVHLDPDSLALYLGGAGGSFKATVSPATADQKIKWKSLNPGVASIDSMGKITAVGVGETYIEGKSVANGIYASSQVTVKRDVPRLTVASKTGAPINTEIAFSPKAAQEYGSIVMYKWDLDGDGAWDDSLSGPYLGTTVDLPPQRARYAREGNVLAKFYVRDGEGNDTIAKVALDIGNQAPEIQGIRADTSVSIKDSISMTATVRDVDGKVVWCGWDYEGDGIFDDSIAPSDAQVEADFGHRYPDAGAFPAVFKARDETGKSRLDTVKVKVELDRPAADAGSDTTVTVGSKIEFHAGATDKYGRIVKREIRLPGPAAGFQVLSNPDTLLVAPAEPGSFAVVLRVTDDDGLMDVDSMIVTVVLSANAELSNLAFSAGPIDPVFKPTISFFSARALFTDSSVTVTPTAKEATAQISVNAKPVASGTASAPVKLSVGTNINVFHIVVTAADGTQRVYNLSVVRDPSADAALARLDVTGFLLKPSFTPNTVDYADTVASSTASITLKPTLASPFASLTLNDTAMASGTATPPLPLSIGENLYTLAVTSQSGTAKTVYRIKVVRKANLILLRSLGGAAATLTDSTEAAPGAPVSVSSAPVTGYHFLKWTVLEGTAVLSDSTADPTGIILKSAKARVLAVFGADSKGLILKAYAGIGGSIAPESLTVAEGASQDFSITVNKGYRIHVLQDNGVDVTSAIADGKYPLAKITQAHTLSLTFQRRFDLTGKTNGNGSITPIDSSADSLANVTYRFQPKSGRYRFNGFWDFGKPVKPASETAHTFPAITTAHACSVAFLRMFKVEGLALNAGGTVTPDADAFVDSLASRIFTITPNPLVSGSGYRVDSVWDNGNLVTTTGSDPYGTRKYQIDSIKADHVLKVKFKRYHVLKAIVETGDATGKVDPGSVIVDEGGQQDYKYGPAGGYYAASLTDNGIHVPVSPGGGAYSIPKVGEPHTLVLTFRNTVTIKLSTNIPWDSKVQPILCVYGKEKSECTETGSVGLELPYGSGGTIEAEKYICTDGSDNCRVGIPFLGWRDSDNPEKLHPENPKELSFDRNQAWEAVYDLKAVP